MMAAMAYRYVVADTARDRWRAQAHETLIRSRPSS